MVLEAKIVCGNGFSISIATEWIKNPVDKEYDKQDCELKAFVRLASKIKKSFPRLPVCISADGLYPNNTVFDICENNNWKYIITLKDGNLKSVWEEIGSLDRIGGNIKLEVADMEPNKRIKEQYKAYQNIEYQKHELSIIDLTIKSTLIKTNEKEPDERFAHVTNFELSEKNIEEISHEGRLRWKIENEGFNEQKNGGYNLKHKYSRKSFIATQNYYQCLQIAHMINQLAYKAKAIKELIKGNDTLKSNHEVVVALFMVDDFEGLATIIEQTINQNIQFRY